MDKVFERLREPSTYAGLAAVTIGIGQIVDFDEAGQVASIVQGAGERAAVGDWIGAGVAALLGLAAIFKREGR
ncbi:hypothetical protein [Pyruvatibacter mobilis]|jgi:hypothetical protein|uniref:hypothetical protein n=1 Tax=Pyruvatibacter mobilis TaxID=1712261 RepID=UPI003BAACB91